MVSLGLTRLLVHGKQTSVASFSTGNCLIVDREIPCYLRRQMGQTVIKEQYQYVTVLYLKWNICLAIWISLNENFTS